MKLEEAVNNIYDVYSHESVEKFPYFLIIGAGVSSPEIPLASQIIEMCMKKCETKSSFDEWKKESESKSNSEKYSFWLSKAFPEKEFRRQLFASLTNDAKITSSNFQIANILASKQIFNLVVTTNFDIQIEKSLNLLNFFDYYSSSNVIDNLSINLRTNDIQIVHVHGDYRNYDLKNLISELNSASVQNESMSMKDVLSNALNNRSAIVIGYSGWENDIIMTTLKERLKYDTPYRFYWFCYDKKSFDNMPDWLKSNDNVCFVYPDGFSLQEDTDFLNQLKRFKLASDVIGVTTLPAYYVLSALTAKFNIDIPELFENPLLPCENIVNHISKTDSVFDVDSLLDEYRELFKIHEHNRTTVEKIATFYNNKKYNQFARLFKKNFGKKSTMSDSDFNNVLNNYAVKVIQAEDCQKELRIALSNYIFRIPLYRNTDRTRAATCLALSTLTSISKDLVDIDKFKKLYTYYENNNDLLVLVCLKMRFVSYPDFLPELWETEYRLAKSSIDNYKNAFYLAIFIFPYYITLVATQSLAVNDKNIMSELLKELNNDDYLELRKNEQVRECLQISFNAFNKKSWINDSIFKTTKALFDLK